MNKLLCLMALCLLLSACESRRERMTRVWFFTVADFGDGGAPTNYAADADNPMNLSPESFLNLQADGHYTSYFGRYDEGEWSLRENKVLELASGRGTRSSFDIEYAGRNMKLYYAPRAARYTFQPYASAGDKEEGNPFSHRNNYWRIKPAQKESDAQVRARLVNYFHYWELYFKWGEKSGLTTLTVNAPGPLRLYGNGFELIPFEEEPYDWKNHFFDTADAHRAYDQLHGLVAKRLIQWPNTDNRFVMFASVFQQMQQQLRQ